MTSINLRYLTNILTKYPDEPIENKENNTINVFRAHLLLFKYNLTLNFPEDIIIIHPKFKIFGCFTSKLKLKKVPQK